MINARRVVAQSNSSLALRISGNRFIDGAGRTVQLRGSTRSSQVYAARKGKFEDGQWDQASVAAMAAWGMNVVRLPLNETFWLGVNGMPVSPMTASQYRADVAQYVGEIQAAGMRVILVLTGVAPSGVARGFHLGAEVADMDHSPAFWQSVANTFKDAPGVMFELFNEPNNVSAQVALNGGQVHSRYYGSYQAAGYNQLIQAVRATGASNPVLVGAPSWSSDIRRWLSLVPHDPAGQIACACHPYDNSYWLHTPAEWSSYITPILNAGYPVAATECGSHDCKADYINSFMAFCDRAGVSYLPFGWNPWGCSMPSLIRDWNGTRLGIRAGHSAALPRSGSRNEESWRRHPGDDAL